MRPDRRTDGYLPIAAYGLIGDCRSAALVGDDGSIDWLCLPRFDHASIFARILDARRGGHWQVRARGTQRVQQRYRDLTNVLSTTFTTARGRVVVTDFMPIHEDTITHDAQPYRGPRVVRLVECLGGAVSVVNEMHPAPDYARTSADVFRAEGGQYHADTDQLHFCFRSSDSLGGAQTHHQLRSGEAVAFALIAAEPGQCPAEEWSVARARDLLRETVDFWWRWVAQVSYQGPYAQPVKRSALALKLMSYAPTGAIVAAPTTSLPEGIGGERNWDYRFTWLRDASFSLFGFFQLGLLDEAEAFFHWLAHIGVGVDGRPVDNLYDLDGERDLVETTLPHLEGYRGSRPVRVGNGAAQQRQLDVYGEVLDSAYLYVKYGGRIGRGLWNELCAIVDKAIADWQLPDSSIWEPRGEEQHFTYSKVMCWVAVDRGLRIAERLELPHRADAWKAARRAIHRHVASHGWNEAMGTFTQTLDGSTCDAAMLRLSQVRFLPDRDPRLRRTLDAVGRRLRDGELVRRYLVQDSSDGLSGDEGAFLMCSFWLVDALAHSGEIEEAQRLFEQLLCFASPLGLLSEEADARTGALLGNYPQAFTHLALIGAAVNIERARHRELAPRGLEVRPPRATHRRRARE